MDTKELKPQRTKDCPNCGAIVGRCHARETISEEDCLLAEAQEDHEIVSAALGMVSMNARDMRRERDMFAAVEAVLRMAADDGDTASLQARDEITLGMEQVMRGMQRLEAHLGYLSARFLRATWDHKDAIERAARKPAANEVAS